jgi:cytoskeleton protein RodZ
MNQTTETPKPSAMDPGAWLKSAREQASIPVEQVAKELNLDVRKIEAIEAGRFAVLGAPVYARGYLRKYARLVNVPESVLLQRYESTGAGVAVDPVPSSLGTIPETRRLLPRWVLWVVLGLVVLAAAASLWNMRSPGEEANVGVMQDGVQVENFTEVSPLESLPAAPDATLQGAAGPLAPVAGQLQLTFRFGTDSWAEAYDVNNQQVLYETVATGSERSVNARPPVRVVLGSASAVTVRVNSRELVVPASRIEGNVARFVVNSNGTIAP